MYGDGEDTGYENGNGGNHGNKIRRGPGRRLAKEKRKRQMDQALLEKYLSLTPDHQVEVNAVIETCYRRQQQNKAQYVQHETQPYNADFAEGEDSDPTEQ